MIGRIFTILFLSSPLWFPESSSAFEFFSSYDNQAECRKQYQDKSENSHQAKAAVLGCAAQFIKKYHDINSFDPFPGEVRWPNDNPNLFLVVSKKSAKCILENVSNVYSIDGYKKLLDACVFLYSDTFADGSHYNSSKSYKQVKYDAWTNERAICFLDNLGNMLEYGDVRQIEREVCP